MNRNASKHAAGVVITPGDVSEYVPLANAVSQQEIVTQYNMKDIENVGLLKMDFLGLRTVITSYSIHYTKLYDPRPGIFSPPVSSSAPSWTA